MSFFIAFSDTTVKTIQKLSEWLDTTKYKWEYMSRAVYDYLMFVCVNKKTNKRLIMQHMSFNVILSNSLCIKNN